MSRIMRTRNVDRWRCAARPADGDAPTRERDQIVPKLSVRGVVKLCGYARPVAARAGRHDTAI